MIVHQPIKPEPFNNLQGTHIPLAMYSAEWPFNKLQVDTIPLAMYSIEWHVNNLQVDTYPTCNVFS